MATEEKAAAKKEVRFMKVSELTPEEIKTLPRAKFTIIRSLNRRTMNENYSITFVLAQGLSIIKRIKQAEFEIIKKKYRFDGGYNNYSSHCPCRLSCGERPDHSIFYFAEFVLDINYIFRDFLDNDQAMQIEVCELEKQGLKIFDRGSNTEDLESTFTPLDQY